MVQKILWRILLFALLVLMQALIFDNIHIAGYAIPMPYVYFLLIFHSHTNRSVLLLWGFALGATVGLFSNTAGAAAVSMTLVAFVRPYLLSMFTPRDKEEEGFEPSPLEMKWGAYIRYAGSMVLLHEITFFALETFSFFNWEKLLLNTACSFVLTLLIICMFESIHIGGTRVRTNS